MSNCFSFEIHLTISQIIDRSYLHTCYKSCSIINLIAYTILSHRRMLKKKLLYSRYRKKTTSKIWSIMTNFFFLFICDYWCFYAIFRRDSFKRFIELIFRVAKETRFVIKALNPGNIFAEHNPEETTVLLYLPGNIDLSHLHREHIITERSFSANDMHL